VPEDYPKASYSATSRRKEAICEVMWETCGASLWRSNRCSAALNGCYVSLQESLATQLTLTTCFPVKCNTGTSVLSFIIVPTKIINFIMHYRKALISPVKWINRIDQGVGYRYLTCLRTLCPFECNWSWEVSQIGLGVSPSVSTIYILSAQ
jgi:hypothetical protein